MPQPDLGRRLLPSILDRLTDPDALGHPSAPGYSEREMMAIVRADLEDLLNTRRTEDGTRPRRDPQTGGVVTDPVTGLPATEVFPEVQRSIVAYGLPDLVGYSPTIRRQHEELARLVERVITGYEPRLKKVRVVVTPGGGQSGWSVRFHIDAALNVDPAPEVGFETVIELLSGRTTVRSDEGRG